MLDLGICIRLHLFPRNQILAIEYSHFKDQPQECYDRVCNFLGVSSQKVPDQRINPSVSILSPKLQFVIRKMNNVRVHLQKNKASSKHRRDWPLEIFQRARAPKPLSPQQREELSHYFKEDIKKLEKLLNWDLSSWLTS